MSVLGAAKVVGSLPGTLVPDTIYAVRTGVGFDLYVSDATGSVAHPVNVPTVPGVPLFGDSVTNEQFLIADNFINTSLYSSYTITGQLLPATDGVALRMDMRSSAPADGNGTLSFGRTNVNLSTGNSGANTQNSLINSVISTNGITFFRLDFSLRASRYALNFQAFYQAGTSPTVFVATVGSGHITGAGSGMTGIKLFFSSGNIAEGWMEIVGHKRQSP